MKNVGIVRKIDKLGRIVIPKEVRNTLRILDDDNLELYIEGENIVLKKYSYLKNFKEISKYLLNSINIGDDTIILYDSDSIIDVIGKYKKDLINKKPGNILLKNMNFYNSFDATGNIEIIDGFSLDIEYHVKPVILNGMVIGIIMLLSKTKMNMYTVNIIDYIGDFLGTYICS